MPLPLQPAPEHVAVHFVVVHDEDEADHRLRFRDGRFVQRPNGGHDAFAQARFGQQVRLPRAGGQRLQKLRVVEESEQRLCGLTDFLKVGNEAGMVFLIRILLA